MGELRMNVTAIMSGSKKALNGSTGKILFHVFYFGFGIISANATVFGEFSPFGMSAAAAVPFPNAVFSAIGSVIGYMMFGKRNFRYAAAVIADLDRLYGEEYRRSFLAAGPLRAFGRYLRYLSGKRFSFLASLA